MREIGRNLNKLVRDLKAQESPEAMVYLRLMGNELGYLNTKDMEEMTYSAAMMIDNMMKMFPTDVCIQKITYIPIFIIINANASTIKHALILVVAD